MALFTYFLWRLWTIFDQLYEYLIGRCKTTKLSRIFNIFLDKFPPGISVKKNKKNKYVFFLNMLDFSYEAIKKGQADRTYKNINLVNGRGRFLIEICKKIKDIHTIKTWKKRMESFCEEKWYKNILSSEYTFWDGCYMTTAV